MSTLRPEIRYNKNGVPVTKYVRSEPFSRSLGRKTAPAPEDRLDPVAASAILCVIGSRIPDPNDERAHLIRELMNTGMDDDEAVEFLALAYMPIELLREVSGYIDDDVSKASANHRQNFFRFANSAYFDNPSDKAFTLVRNGMLVMPEDMKFTYCTGDRISALSRHGIDCREELSGTDILAAQSLLAVTHAGRHVPRAEAERYFEMSEEFDRDGKLARIMIKDQELANFVLRSGERYPELAALIKERNTVDPELLEAALESPAPAVREGIL